MIELLLEGGKRALFPVDRICVIENGGSAQIYFEGIVYTTEQSYKEIKHSLTGE